MKRKRSDCVTKLRSKQNCLSADDSWDRCQDGFDPDIILEGQRSSARKSVGSKKGLKSKLLSNARIGNQQDVDISWSSSEDDSDSADALPLVFESPERPKTSFRSTCHDEISSEDQPPKQVVMVKVQSSQASQASELLISDYESTEESDASEEVEEFKQISNTPQVSETYSIGSISSSLPSSSVTSSGENKTAMSKKGSNLINLMKQQIKSPQTETDEIEPLDSAKKKSKYLRGGLAERLQKLISRERSSVAMWNHHVADKAKASGTALTVCVQKINISRGIYVSECIDTSDSDHAVLHVLFSTSTARQLCIAEGSIVTIYPPWQRLNLPTHSEPILLCTHYCQLVGQDSTNVPSTSTQTTRRKMTFDTWPSDDKSAVRPVLEEVTIQPVKSLNEDDQASDSILDSIADSSGHSTKGMCIRATVQRVCCYNSPTNDKPDCTFNIQWFMLLQDIRGVFCEMYLPDDCHHSDSWKEYLNAEGETLIFKGAKVLQRTKRSRSSRLFSMLDSMWPPSDKILPASFNSQSDSEQASHIMPAPSFCYVLKLDSDIITKSNKQHVIYRSSTECNLNTVSSLSPRISLYSKVLYSTCTSTDKHVLKRIYLTDLSLGKGHRSECDTADINCFAYRCLLLDASCVVESNLIGHVFMFKDVFLENGELYADKYSRIVRVDNPCVYEEYENVDVHLQPLHADTNQFELVLIQGEVIGADESSAYQWSVCGQCGSDKLCASSSSINDQFYCQTCKMNITSTDLKMYLEVYIRCAAVKQAQVKVQLLQSSIEKILPPITPEVRSQGFDMQSIMGKQLGPISAIVRNTSEHPNQFILEEIKI
ncbi:DNA repair-scaffolding protein-like [Antedon mediterranea]|uniref:DNA repair-scaffolding protein-like n=1 Tax=Antedon mediterranea TaxID=105859 RepID=UPI003AF81242